MEGGEKVHRENFPDFLLAPPFSECVQRFNLLCSRFAWVSQELRMQLVIAGERCANAITARKDGDQETFGTFAGRDR